MLVTIALLRALAEVAGAFLLGHGLLHILAGASRERNAVYRLFRFLTRPVLSLARRVMPSATTGQIGVAAFFVLLVAWLALAWLRFVLCGGICS